MVNKQKALENKRRFYVKQRELGLCLECTNKVKPNCSRCEACLTRRQARGVERKEWAIQNGMCSHCISIPTLLGHKMCEQCYYRDISHKHFKTGKYWAQLKSKFATQSGKCALSGCDLIIGVNAELDHINPSSRGGESELDNVQWVLCVVNRMKDHMTETEFFGLVEKLYHTMKGQGDIDLLL